MLRARTEVCAKAGCPALAVLVLAPLYAYRITASLFKYAASRTERINRVRKQMYSSWRVFGSCSGTNQYATEPAINPSGTSRVTWPSGPIAPTRQPSTNTAVATITCTTGHGRGQRAVRKSTMTRGCSDARDRELQLPPWKSCWISVAESARL